MIEVLGAARVDGVALASRAQRVVVAALVLDRGQTVSTDRLADLIWADQLPRRWRGALQSHVSRLRPLLPPGTVIDSDAQGYRLLVDDEAGIDVEVFVRAHARAVTDTNPRQRQSACDDGLAVWTGRPYDDLDDARSEAERARLTELATGLGELRAGALIELGRHHEAIATLESMRAVDPLREQTVQHLMHALVATGRKRDALAAYSDLHERLVGELGLEPDAALRALRDAIVTETYVAPPSADARHDPAVVAEPAVVTRALPRRPDDLVGRRSELTKLADLVQRPGAVSIVGPGGVGKTRLAFHFARRHDHGFDRIDVVELAQLSDASALADAVASALGIPAQSDLTAAERVAAAVRSGRRLLVLDNCEHVIEPVARLVDRLLRSGEDVHVLATSREPLNVDRETVFRLRPLDEDDAVELLARRLDERGRGRDTGGEATGPMQRIARAVDGLPLGIELAAAHGETMTLAEIADAVDDPLELLTRGRRTADGRHRSLRAVLDWSVRDLDAVQRSVLTASAVFAGPFTTTALAAVADRPHLEIRRAVADLVDRSLFVTEEGPGGRMLHSTMTIVRALASELLDASDGRTAAEELHTRWAVRLVEAGAHDVAGWAEAERQRVVDVHLPDLRVVHRRLVDQGDAERSMRLAASLHFVAVYRMHAELFAWIAEAADRFGDHDVPGTEAVLASAAVGAWEQGAMARSANLAHRAAQAGTPSLGLGIGASEALADLAGFDGDNHEAIRLFGLGRDAARADGNACRELAALADAAIHHAYEGDVRTAIANVGDARALLGDDGPLAASAWVSYVEGEALAETDPIAALDSLRRAVDDASASGSDFIAGVARLTLAGLEVRVGDLDAAAIELGALLRHWRQGGARLQQWITLRTVLSYLVASGHDIPAARTLGALESERNLAEINGADADRLHADRAVLAARVSAAEFTAWRHRDVDAIADDLLPLLHGA